MYIHTPGWHIFYLITIVSISVTWWHRLRSWCTWPSGQKWQQLWSRCTSVYAPPVCLQTLCGTIMAWKAAGRMTFINYCRVSFYCSLYLEMPRKLHLSRLLFSDYGTWCFNLLLLFLACGARKPSFGHDCHIPGNQYGRLYQLHRQQCKLTIDCTTRTRALVQLLASFPWTAAQHPAYRRL